MTWCWFILGLSQILYVLGVSKPMGLWGFCTLVPREVVLPSSRRESQFHDVPWVRVQTLSLGSQVPRLNIFSPKKRNDASHYITKLVIWSFQSTSTGNSSWSQPRCKCESIPTCLVLPRLWEKNENYGWHAYHWNGSPRICHEALEASTSGCSTMIWQFRFGFYVLVVSIPISESDLNKDPSSYSDYSGSRNCNSQIPEVTPIVWKLTLEILGMNVHSMPVSLQAVSSHLGFLGFFDPG